MSPRPFLVFGSGKRVLEAALPAFGQAGQDFELRGIYARTAKQVVACGKRHEVLALEALDARAFEGVELVYVAVKKGAVPEVLARLESFGPERFDLLVDTPVLLLKHYKHAQRLERFRNAWAAEDCIELPWLELVQHLVQNGALGALESAHFERSAYAYHGHALLKALFGQKLTTVRRKRAGEALFRREFAFEGGLRATLSEPRDYSVGHFEIHGSRRTLSDARELPQGALGLAPWIEDGQCVGLQAGLASLRFDAQEAALMAADAPEASVTARMESLKRVGFLRLLRKIAGGQGGYPVREALEDMVSDELVTRLGTFHSWLGPKAAFGRFVLRNVSKLGS